MRLYWMICKHGGILRSVELSLPVSNAALTSHRDHTHVSPSAVHLGAKEPTVLGDGVAFNAAKRVAGTSTAAHTKQNT